MAERMNAEIHLIHVMEKTPPPLSGQYSGKTEEEKLISMEKEFRSRLSETAETLSEDSNIRIVEVFRIGTDYEEIVNYSKEINSDLIVIATHGRTGIFHTLLGSVAEKVIRFSKCPVLVISPQEEE